MFGVPISHEWVWYFLHLQSKYYHFSICLINLETFIMFFYSLSIGFLKFVWLTYFLIDFIFQLVIPNEYFISCFDMPKKLLFFPWCKITYFKFTVERINFWITICSKTAKIGKLALWIYMTLMLYWNRWFEQFPFVLPGFWHALANTNQLIIHWYQLTGT